MNLTTYYWGQDKLVGNKIDCGPWGATGCYGDSWFNCANQLYPAQIENFSACFTQALFNAKPPIGVPMSMANIVNLTKQCATPTIGVDYDTVTTCATGPQGFAFDKIAMTQQAKLAPDQNYVPWITVAGQHDSTAESSPSAFIQRICKLYTGTDKPAACSNTTAFEMKLESNQRKSGGQCQFTY